MSYLVDTAHAVKTIFEGLNFEADRLTELKDRLKGISGEIARNESVVSWSVLNPDLDDDGIGTATHWENYFETLPRADAVKREIDEVTVSMKNREFSMAALAGNLLQIAKQGISVRYANLSSAPPGRMVGSVSLSSIVWQGRNQAMHWEEGNFRSTVTRLFETLNQENRNMCADFRTRSVAREVINVLGWNSPADFERDMALLLV